MIKPPIRPTCQCFECRYYGLVYSSFVNVYECKECETKVQEDYVGNIVTAYGVYCSANPPMLYPYYNAITCISCLENGGIRFKGRIMHSAFCDKCKYDIPIHYLHDAMVTAYKTKLFEKTYQFAYTTHGGGL